MPILLLSSFPQISSVSIVSANIFRFQSFRKYLPFPKFPQYLQFQKFPQPSPVSKTSCGLGVLAREKKDAQEPKGSDPIDELPGRDAILRLRRPGGDGGGGVGCQQWDRSENADYQYAKRRLRQIDERIRHLSKRMEAADVVDPERLTVLEVRAERLDVERVREPGGSYAAAKQV